MVEALYNASGLGLPIVMTVANGAIGAPINIWNDHSDSMSQRDSGWIQLYAETNQEALDMHIQAFRIAEEVSLPVMVCMDGFILTHAYEEVDILEQAQVDVLIRAPSVLDPADPVTIGAMVGPEAFFEVKYLAHAKQAMDLIPEVARSFASEFGRESGGLLRTYRAMTPRRSWSRSARCWGRSRRRSTSCATRGFGSARWPEVVPPLPAGGRARGARRRAARRRAREGARCGDRRDRLGQRPHRALWHPASRLHGDRRPRRPLYHQGVAAAAVRGGGARRAEAAQLPRPEEAEIVERELARVHADRASGPHEENILQDIGVVAAEPH